MENVITLGKLLSLWFYFRLLSILFLKTQTSYHTYKIISSNELARPVVGTIFLVVVVGYTGYSTRGASRPIKPRQSPELHSFCGRAY